MSGSRCAGRLSAAAACLGIVAFVAGGCTETRPTARSAAPDRRSSAGVELRPASLPELSAIEDPVRQQLQEMSTSLERKQAAAGTPAGELADAYGDLGKLLMAAKIVDVVEPYFLNAETLAPQDPRWPYYLGQLYRSQGALPQAEASFKRTLELRPGDVPTLVWLGELYLVDGRSKDAASLFAQALAERPQDPAALFGLGRAALAQRDYAGAVSRLEALLAQYPNAASAHYPLALAYRGLGDAAKAEAHAKLRGEADITTRDPLMDALQELVESPVSYEIRGTQALNREDWNGARSEFEKGLALDPANASLRQKMGTALYMLGRTDQARETFEEVVRRAPDYAPAYYSLGVLLESEGRYAQAVDRFTAAVARQPTYVEALVRLAENLRRIGRLTEAVAHYDQALSLDPRLSEAALGRALTLIRLERYREARDRLREALNVHPNDPLFTHTLSRLLAAAPDAQLRDGKQALAMMQALSEESRTLDLGETMAMAFAEVGRYQEAIAWQRDAIARARQSGQPELAERMTGNLQLYEMGKPCRTPWREGEIQ